MSEKVKVIIADRVLEAHGGNLEDRQVIHNLVFQTNYPRIKYRVSQLKEVYCFACQGRLRLKASDYKSVLRITTVPSNGSGEDLPTNL